MSPINELDGHRADAMPGDGLQSPSCITDLSENRRSPELSEANVQRVASASQIARFAPAWLRAVEWCALAVLAVAFIAQSFVPGWRTLRSEFPNYYLAAELYHRNLPLNRVYEWTWFQRQNDHLGVRDGLVSFAPNPPTSILALLPFTRLQPLAAKRAWMVSSLVCLALSLLILKRVTSLGWRRLILVTLMCVLPLKIDFLSARQYVLILLFVCTAYYAAQRNRHWTSGIMWSAAAAMKLFPALAVILFFRKRNLRALVGFAMGTITLAAASVAVFGVEIHKVFLREVLSQASRGDWLGPYALSQNSFITLWSHLFLIEPELNPAPWVNSPTLYALAMAITVTALVFAFLLSIRNSRKSPAEALHWAALGPFLLLLSTTTAPDHSCLLIFSAIVGFDALLAMGRKRGALILLLSYVTACAPIPHRISQWFPLYRLVAITAFYLLLLAAMPDGGKRPPASRWIVAGLITVAALTLYNLHTVRYRAEDFGGRVPTPVDGYRFANPVPVADGVAFTEMLPARYGSAVMTSGAVRNILAPGDVLSVAGSTTGIALYAELTARESSIVMLPPGRLGPAFEPLTEGQEPALSPNGKWLAFIREDQGRGAVWLATTDSTNTAQAVLPIRYEPLEVTVTNDGDVIASAGPVSDPRLLFVKHGTGEIVALPEFPHPARYPSVSPDGKRLAFSRRDGGSWHLMIRALSTGEEQQLTHASCNAISPSWQNAETLLYATDCGRGVGLSAIAHVVLPY